MTKTFKSLSTSFTPERNASLDVDHEASLVNFDPSSFLTETEASSSRFAPIYGNTLEQTGVNLEASTPFVDMSDRTGGGYGEQYPDEQIGQEQVAQEQVVREIFASQFDVFNISPSFSDERSLDSMIRVLEIRNICFSQMTMAGTCNLVALVVLGAELGFNFSVEKYEQMFVMKRGQFPARFYNIMKAEYIWESEYRATEMRGATPGILAFNTPSIPIRPRKSRRLSEVSSRSDAEVTDDLSSIVVIQDSEDNTEGVSLPNQEEIPAVKDGSEKIPSATDAADMQKADDSSARGSVPGELNEPKDLGDASRSKGKGKVDLVDKKAAKKRIAAKAKANLEAGRILAFRIGGFGEVLPSEAPVAQSLGVTPPASLPVSSDSAAVPPSPAVQTAVNVPQPLPPRAFLTPSSRPASEFSSESSLSKRRHTTEVPRQRASGPLGNSSVWVPPRHDNRWSFSHTDDELPLVSSDIKIGAELIRNIGGIGVINSGSRIISAYEAVVTGKEEQIKSRLAPTDVDAARKELDSQNARADSWIVSATQIDKVRMITRLKSSLEKSRLTDDCLRKERDGARHRADEIAGDSSTQSARHSSRLERIRLYLVALQAQEEVKAQLCYRCGARISLEKMVEAEYKLPPGLLENDAKEKEEYLATVVSLAADSLGDDILFPTPPPPPVGPPQDVSSQVPEGISEHGTFFSPQDNQDGDLV
ncbi:hypothetical protein AALP_AA6G207200 [Arabis alpina]|uniref:Uncharacterized protein n=1 Tax=Arabis alpina TaxID=50452 RepID=A0A087GQM2_ARAAL|nr:hypothetical protein AALP_AA6G207200 [Arabis alpina]